MNGLAIDRAVFRQPKAEHPVKFDLTEHNKEALDAHIKTAGIKLGQFL